MATLYDPQTLATMRERLSHLKAVTPAGWGRFDAPRMVCHLRDSLEMALGRKRVRSKKLWPFQVFPLKHLALYVLPFPKGAPTAPELLSRAPGPAFESDLAHLDSLLEEFSRAPQQGPGAEHPLFGRLDQKEWGVLVHRHLDHHFRQFGL